MYRVVCHCENETVRIKFTARLDIILRVPLHQD